MISTLSNKINVSCIHEVDFQLTCCTRLIMTPNVLIMDIKRYVDI